MAVTKVFSYTLWPWAYFTNGLDAASSSAPNIINITHKNTFCSHFWRFGWHYIQLSIFQLSIVKLLKMSTDYANPSMETLSLFIDSSIDNVMLQTNPDLSVTFRIHKYF